MARDVSSLVDQFGRPIAKEMLTREIAAPEFGTTRAASMGTPADGLTPARLGAIMREADAGDPLRFFELAEIIEERDLHYAGVLGTRKRQVSQIPIRVEAASDAPEHVKHAEMLEAWLKRDTLQSEIFHMLDAVDKGISFTEIMWDTSEGQWQPARLAWRSQRFFTFDRVNLETPMLRNAQGVDEALMPFKFLVTTIQAKSGLAIRSGIARIAAWAWMWKKFTERDWALFTQSYGQPVRIGKFKAGATEEERRKLLMAVTNIAADCAAIIPDSMTLDFVEAKTAKQSSDAYLSRVNYLDQQVSKGVLGQTATTDAIAGGHAVGQEHREVQKDIARADALALQAVLNMQLVKPWVMLEHGPQKLYPRFIIEQPEAEDLEALRKAIETYVPMGLKVSMTEVRDKYRLSEPSADDELLTAPAKAAPAPPADDAPPPGQKPKVPRPSLHSAEPSTAPAATRDVIDDLAEIAGEDWEELLSPIVAQLQQELLAAASLEDLKQRIASLTASADVMALTEALSNARTVAFMAGLAETKSLAEPAKPNG